MAWSRRAALLALCCTAEMYAADAHSHQEFMGRLQRAEEGEVLTIKGLDLRQSELRDLELERFEVWAPDAEILVWEGGTTPRHVPVPRGTYFKGRVVGSDDSLVYLALRDGAVTGTIIDGIRRYAVGTARRVPRVPRVRNQEIDASVETWLVAAEEDDFSTTESPGQTWSCDLDDDNVLSESVPNAKGLVIKPEGGAPAGATYALRIAIETDNEFCAGFSNNTTSISNYIADLVGKSSLIYERDVQTALLLGLVSIRTAADPFSATTTDEGLSELGKEWVNNSTLENSQRSAVLMLSGKGMNGGIAWRNQLCVGHGSCGADGSNCNGGFADPVFANSFFGPFGFVGSLSGIPVSTTVPDPTVSTGDGVQFSMGNSNNFWMLAAFAHELGHIVASRHSSCILLSASQKTEFGIGSTSMPNRDFVDTCLTGEGSCFSGTASAPTEYGTIMSYCHNVFLGGGYRASRYYLGKAGEASSLMLPIFKNAIDSKTPNGVITIGAAPLACSSGQVASVPNVAGMSYLWQITGGTIPGSATGNSVAFTPSGASVVLTVTITNNNEDHGCSITTSVTRATACGAILPPTNVAAISTSATGVFVSWSASNGAVDYHVFRSTDGVNYTQLLEPVSASTSHLDGTATAGTAYLYRVRAVDGSNNVSGDSGSDLATTVIFTDPTLVAGVTIVKAIHFEELRTAVNALRTLTALAPMTFSGAAPGAGIGVKAAHVAELRSGLAEARSALGMGSTIVTDPTITAGVGIKRAHINELRVGTQ